MGTGDSKNPGYDNSREGKEGETTGGRQLYVSLKIENFMATGELIPHVYVSVPIVGSCDPSKALSMERESASMWELCFVVPPDHETLDFKFILKPKYSNGPCVVEEGPSRSLKGGTLGGDVRLAHFRIRPGGTGGGDEELIECRVISKADMVSPFELAASWRAYQDNLKQSTVRGIPDVSINAVPVMGFENGSAASLELDLEHYVVPAPASCVESGMIYTANLTENPRSLNYMGIFSNVDGANFSSRGSTKASGVVPIDRSRKDMELLVSDPSKTVDISGMVDSKSVGTFSPLQKLDVQRGLLVDRGVGYPGHVKSASASAFTTYLKLDSETKDMPAAAVADKMLGPKEDRRLAIVLVGLPARGKTFTGAKLTRYLRWLGHDTKHFNVGKYRRLKLGANQSADFFLADNSEGLEARNEVAALAMEDMLYWMQEGGQVGIFDATNSTRKRRNMLMKMAEGQCKIIFLETICNDERIIQRNIRLKIQQSPDYAEEPDYEAGLQDFRARLANYEKAYEPVEEGSYIKMIDTVSGCGGQIQVNNISGCLPGRIVFFLISQQGQA